MTDRVERLDSLGMFDAAAAFPEQVAEAAENGRRIGDFLDGDEVTSVVVLGMGGSGIAGDLLAAVAGPFVSVPVVVVKEYELPGFVGEGALVFALSFSGNTEETIQAAAEAAGQGARVVAVCRGGELGRLADSWAAPHVPIPDGIPMPRAGLGALAIPPMIILEDAGLFPGASEWIRQAVVQLRRRRDQLIADANPARELARRLQRTFPLVYGAGPLGSVAALRWKNQINENPKSPAFLNRYPELCHNEVAGWAQSGDVTRQVFSVVNLRHDHEHPSIGRRVELVSSLVEEVVARIEEVHAEGEGPLAQVLDLILFGDLVSLHLAFQEEVDPGPIPALDFIKSALNE